VTVDASTRSASAGEAWGKVVVETRSADETRALGAFLAGGLVAGDVLLLMGGFGVGKTTLTQGLGEGLAVEGDVTSPSFVIANEYPGQLPLYHVDLYRIEEMDRVTLEALAEYFGGDGVCVVEWPRAVPLTLIKNAVHIELEVTGEETRRITLGPAPRRLIDAMRRWPALRPSAIEEA
jgi:tRNA threonylcarbamoyladenosine biosynthesis protein TsaE